MASRNMDYEKLMSIYNNSLTTLYGPQRLLTFDDCNGGGSSSGGDKPPQPRSLKIRIKFKSSEKEGIKEYTRERITSDLRIVNDKMRETTFRANDCEVSPPEREVLPPETTVGVLPEETKGVNERIRREGLRKNWKRLCVTLSKQEIEEDFMKMLGQKPPRRPKNKRSKTLQNQIDLLNPGSYISKITEDRYDVPETGQKRKR